MPPRKTATTKTKSSSSSTAKTAPKKHNIWPGVAAIAAGVLIAHYLILGLVLTLTTYGGGYARFWTGIFDYGASLSVVPGYSWRFLLSVVVVLLFVAAGVYGIYLILKSRIRSTLFGATAAVFALSFIAMLFVPRFTNSVVGYHSFLDRTRALNQFQDKRKELSGGVAQQESSIDDIRSQALQQLLLADMIRQEAAKFGVKVTDKQVEEAYKQYAERNQGEDNLKKQIKDFLGWSPRDFKNEIRTKLQEEELAKKISSDKDLNKEARAKAEDFLKQVKEQNKDFAEVAKQSDDPTAQSGGDVPAFKKGENDKAIEEAAFKLNPGEVSGIIETESGFVIIKLESKTDDTVKIRQITVRTKTLQDYLPEQLKKANVTIFVKNLEWNKELTSVQVKAKKNSQNEATPAPAASGEAVPATAVPAPAAQ